MLLLQSKVVNKINIVAFGIINVTGSQKSDHIEDFVANHLKNCIKKAAPCEDSLNQTNTKLTMKQMVL